MIYLLPYYSKLTLHEIKVLEINATLINANLMENDFRIKKIIIRSKYFPDSDWLKAHV